MLGAKEDTGGLLSATNRVRVGCHEFAKERVEASGGGDAAVPALQRDVQRGGDQAVLMPAGLGRDVHAGGCPLHVGQVLLDFTLKVTAAFVVQEVPLVEREHQRTAGLNGQLQDTDVLLAEDLVDGKKHDATSAFSRAACVRREA